MEFNFEKDIRYAKTILNMNDTEICDFFGISRMTLSRWMEGKVRPSFESLEKIYNKIYTSNINLNRLKEELYTSSLLNDHSLLFHGAKTELNGNPSVNYSDDKKDFGKGFYLGESFNQSASFIVGYPNSSVYIFDFDSTKVHIQNFHVSLEWMILIAYYRGKLDEFTGSNYLKKLLAELNGVDVVIAPIANNTMYTTLDDFIQGKITDLQCLNALSANRLGMQYVFLNDKAINKSLVMLERCYYSTSERKDYQTYRLKENEIGKNKVKLALREYAGKGKYIEELL